jgi:hypothetical protein
LSATGTLLYAGYLGGSSQDGGWDIAVDGSGNAYVTGYTGSTETTFPDGDGFGTLGGPDQSYNGGSLDAFVAKVNASGTAILHAGYIGGADRDLAASIAVDAAGNAYVTGGTASTEATFPDGDGLGSLAAPDRTYNGGFDAFVAKINGEGTALLYAGYVGGSGVDGGQGIAVDAAGSAYVIGSTTSSEASFPDGDGFGAIVGPDRTQNGSRDAFVGKLNAAGTGFVHATYVGGAGDDSGRGIAIDASGAAYVVGHSTSSATTFPDGDGFGVLPSPDASPNGMVDAFVAKIAAIEADPDPPFAIWLTTAALPDFRFQVRLGGNREGAQETDCLAETLCVSGALPGRSEVFVRVIGPRPNGYLWPQVVKFTVSQVEVWIEQTSSGEVQYYELAAADPGGGVLDGLFDRLGFLPEPGALPDALSDTAVGPPPPSASWLTTTALPGFRFQVRIGGNRTGVHESDCLAETLCVSGAVPGRSEVFVRIIGPRPNGFLWPNVVKFTTSRIEVWIEQTTTGQVQYYDLAPADPNAGILAGLFDRTGFLP